jgi:hypothetical protein
LTLQLRRCGFEHNLACVSCNQSWPSVIEQEIHARHAPLSNLTCRCNGLYTRRYRDLRLVQEVEMVGVAGQEQIRDVRLSIFVVQPGLSIPSAAIVIARIFAMRL